MKPKKDSYKTTGMYYGKDVKNPEGKMTEEKAMKPRKKR